MKPRFCFPFLGKKFDFIVKLLLRLLKRNKKMTQEFQDLKLKVEANIALQNQLITSVNALVAKLGQIDPPQEIVDLANQVQAASDAMSTTLNGIPPV